MTSYSKKYENCIVRSENYSSELLLLKYKTQNLKYQILITFFKRRDSLLMQVKAQALGAHCPFPILVT